MSKCYHKKASKRASKKTFRFSNCKGRVVETNFDGLNITKDSGALFLREVARHTGLIESAVRGMDDGRRQASCRHTLLQLVSQRVIGLALGYEDLNDHTDMRHDPALQVAVGSDEALASSATMCRFEKGAGRGFAVSVQEALMEAFFNAHEKPPRQVILDIDATDTPLHGEQEGRFFHGYYRNYCYLPLLVFCGRHLLVAYQRPANKGGAKHAWAILSLLVKEIRRRWPRTEIVLRGDSGFYCPRMMKWCERHGVGYIVGYKGYKPLQRMAAAQARRAERQYRKTGVKQKLFTSVNYTAVSWDAPRRVIVKSEHGELGSNQRFVLTNLTKTDRHLYEKVYCARGDMENRIKEHQLDLFGSRMSCHAWWSNQFRLLLSALAYTLMEQLRRLALRGTELARATPGRIRNELLKIGAVVTRNTRRIRFMLSESFPRKELFVAVAHRLDTS